MSHYYVTLLLYSRHYFRFLLALIQFSVVEKETFLVALESCILGTDIEKLESMSHGERRQRKECEKRE